MEKTLEAGDWRATACILCYINCGIEVRCGGEDGRRFERIRGDKAHPASKGYTCQKALRLDHYQNGRHRLTTPLRRRLKRGPGAGRGNSGSGGRRRGAAPANEARRRGAGVRRDGRRDRTALPYRERRDAEAGPLPGRGGA